MTASGFKDLSPTTLADCLPRAQIMDSTIRPLCPTIARIAGPAYTVLCGPGDNLMLHAAIYRAPAGSVIVVEAADADFALAGGNVCAVAQQNGIAAFVLGGAIRDVAEIRASRFPVFCKGVIPKAGSKDHLGSLGAVVTCGGVRVAPGDVVVGDEEGIVVVPHGDLDAVLAAAQKRAAADAAQNLQDWEQDHRRRIAAILAAKGFAIMNAAFTPTRMRITTARYQKMVSTGVLTKYDRIELIEGEMLNMAPPGPKHATVADRIARLLMLAVHDAAIVSCGRPVNLGDFSDPQPDVVLLKPRLDGYSNAHPEAADVLLLIEVSDSTLTFDQSTKLSLYARYGVSEYWVVDVEGKRVVVYREPAAKGYLRKLEFGAPDAIAPQAFPDVMVAVRDIFA